MKVGYARVSTGDQNLQMQLDALKKAGCERIYQEKRSGAKRDREELAKALKSLQPGDSFIVYKLSRVARSLPHLLEIVHGLQERGVMFVSLTDPIDTTTMTGRLMLNIIGAIDEFLRELIVENTKAGLEASKANGGTPGGAPAFGFGAKYATVDEDESALLKEAAERILSDPKNQLSPVVDDWNARGVRNMYSRRDITARTRWGGKTGDTWSATTLRRQLMNLRVVAIIGQKRYDDLMRIFNAPDRLKKGVPATHLLSGILRCAECEQPMYAKHSTNRDGSELLLYACRATNGGRFKGCGKMNVNYDQADQWMTDAFVVAVCGPILPELIARNSDAETEAIANQLKADRDELEMLARMKGEQRFTIAEWLAMRDPIEARIHENEARLASSSTDDVQALRTLPRTAAEVRALWDGWDVPTRRVWLRRLLDRVVVRNGETRGAPMDERLKPEWKA
jgi:DNA invertase Pin-like site-specific DNA recombinase